MEMTTKLYFIVWLLLLSACSLSSKDVNPCGVVPEGYTCWELSGDQENFMFIANGSTINVSFVEGIRKGEVPWICEQENLTFIDNGNVYGCRTPDGGLITYAK